MNIRKVSMEIMTREFRPFLEEAIKQHPAIIDFRIVRGNIVTAHDYCRRILINARKGGIGRFTAEQIKRLKPPIRVYYSKEGLAFAAVKKKGLPTHWDSYQPPFDVLGLEDEDKRWVTLAIEPSAEEIYALGALMEKGVLPNPVELRTRFTLLEVERALDILSAQIKVFKNGRCVMLWPRRTGDRKADTMWERQRKAKLRKAVAARNGGVE